jgi:hypothetical protein
VAQPDERSDAFGRGHFADDADLKQKFDSTSKQFATLPQEVFGLMGRYCKSLGTAA